MTRDEEGSNLYKFLGKVEYLLKLCFTNAAARDILMQKAYSRRLTELLYRNFLSKKSIIVACKYLYVEAKLLFRNRFISRQSG